MYLFKQLPSCMKYNADKTDLLEDQDIARKNFEIYIKENNCDLPPCYEVLTVLYMMFSAKRSGLAPWAKEVPSIEWCKTILSRC